MRTKIVRSNSRKCLRRIQYIEKEESSRERKKTVPEIATFAFDYAKESRQFIAANFTISSKLGKRCISQMTRLIETWCNKYEGLPFAPYELMIMPKLLLQKSYRNYNENEKDFIHGRKYRQRLTYSSKAVQTYPTRIELCGGVTKGCVTLGSGF